VKRCLHHALSRPRLACRVGGYFFFRWSCGTLTVVVRTARFPTSSVHVISSV
jgi:hypothetical protein